MSQSIYRIPRQKDSALVTALCQIRDELGEALPTRVLVQLHENGPEIDVSGNQLDKRLEQVLEMASELLPRLRLQVTNNERNAIEIARHHEQLTDSVDCRWERWAQHLHGKENISEVFIKVLALVRSKLRVADAEAMLAGSDNNDWGRYRKAQLAILNSLEETQKNLLVEYQKKLLENSEAAKVREEQVLAKLHADHEKKLVALEEAHAAKLKHIEQREEALKVKEKGFETKEARYVARQQQGEQMRGLQERLKDWSLTAGTQKKRRWVQFAYILGLLSTGYYAYLANTQNMELLTKVGDISAMDWWQWLLLGLRSILPVSAFIAFLVYFIRWNAEWAKQHAEEEFLTHSRVLDIGRSSWLLEAVRDAQDNKQPLPEFLLKELSRNLFATKADSSSESTPRLAHELLTNGINTFRIKTADNEVEISKARK